MQEIRELVGTKADMVEHLTAMRDEILADVGTTARKVVDKQRLHGRAEGIELALRELDAWTVTEDSGGPGGAKQPG